MLRMMIYVSWIRHQTDTKSAGFRSQLKVTCGSSHTEELCFNGTVCLWMTIYKYHTMTDADRAALLLTKPSSDSNSGFRHGFGAEASLPLTQSAPVITHDINRLFVLTSF